MRDVDSTLAEDFDWALFPQDETQAPPWKRWLRWLEASFVVTLSWIIWPPLAVVLACLAISFGDFRRAHLASRSIPDRAAKWICLLFGYAWGFWTLGIAAFASFFVVAMLNVSVLREQGMPDSALTAFLLIPCGFVGAVILTSLGLVLALRSGMRIWIGEGRNQARTLLRGVLIVLFTIFGLGPILLLMVASVDRASQASKGSAILGYLFAAMLVGPLAILIVLDKISRRVLASHPGKFGLKVPSVKKGSG